ncbi:MAG: hypothetical protein IKT35_04865 [Clostridia bacterium]|nr:hypothetical protein [Clostridia bacterium]
MKKTICLTLSLFMVMSTFVFSQNASADALEGHLPYVVGDNLMINNADSLDGWENNLFETTLSTGTQIIEGNGSVTMTANNPKGQEDDIGAMTALNIPATDLTDYEKIQIKFYNNVNLSGSNRIQFNFVTGDGYDGFNLNYDATDLAKGWHTICVPRFALFVGTPSNWSSINRICFVWYNTSQISTNVEFTFDEIMGVPFRANAPYAVGNDLMINDCDSTLGWQDRMYHTTITAGADVVEGSGSITMGCTYPCEQSENVASMAILSFPATDFTPYKSIRYKIHFSDTLKGVHQFQTNFITGDLQDGFNHVYTFADLEAGWHTFVFDISSIHQAIPTADWSSINAMRFTWFNVALIDTAVDITLDEIMALEEEHICVPADEGNNENYHWYNCKSDGCAELIDYEAHYGKASNCIAAAVCEYCSYEYGIIDPDNHVNTELQNASISYTGDLYCHDCETVVKHGEEINFPESTATVSTVESSFKKGEIITVPVTISQYDNAFAYITVSAPEYDTSLLRFEGFEASGTDFQGALTDSGDDEFVLIATPTDETSASKLVGGEVCVMKFVALENTNKDTTVSVVVKANGYAYGSEDNWTKDRPLFVETVNGKVTIRETIYGDCNGDDLIDVDDALLVLQTAVKKITLSAEQILRCDVDYDGEITSVDALYILQYSVDVRTRFPIQND